MKKTGPINEDFDETFIEVELTSIQAEYYKQFLIDNRETLLNKITENSMPSLNNLLMQLKRVINHPYLIKGVKNKIENEISQKLGKPITDKEVLIESIVKSSGKMIFIDKYLPILREKHQKVLILSQMNSIFDIFELYFKLTGIKFVRIDGFVNEMNRKKSLESFTNDEDTLVLLISSKCSFTKINLDASNTAIIFDSEMDPQNDIKALMRLIPIGQKFELNVLRLVTRTSFEIEMIKYGMKNLKNEFIDVERKLISSFEIEKIIRGGIIDILENNDEKDKFSDEDIHQILEKRCKLFSSYSEDNLNNKDCSNSKEFWQDIFRNIKSNE